MKIISVVALLGAIAASCSATATAAAQLVSNGSFTSGLTGWTAFNTSNGYGSSVATTFDVSGLGSTTAAEFIGVGELAFAGFGSTPRGAGLTQIVASGGGAVTFSALIAAASSSGNYSAGVASLLIDGAVVTSHDFGQIGSGGILRSDLTYTGTLSRGTHVIGIEATRPFTSANPVDYFTNVSLVGAGAVPEPAAWALLIGGFGLTGTAMRSRRRSVAA